MITLPDDVGDLLDEGRISIRGMIRFAFGGGTYGFIRSQQPFTYAGLTYQPGGLISVSDLSGGVDRSAASFTVSLAASPDDGLTPSVLRTIETEDYRDRPVVVMDAYFHPDTGALLHVQTMRKGYVDVIEHEFDPESGYVLTANCESRALDYTRRNDRRRTVADQARRAPGDVFFEHAAMRGREEVFWGRWSTFQ